MSLTPSPKSPINAAKEATCTDNPWFSIHECIMEVLVDFLTITSAITVHLDNALVESVAVDLELL